MKKLISVILALCFLPICAFADTADDIIAVLDEASKTGIRSALVLADANHRKGSDTPYILRIRTSEGEVEYSIDEEEYLKLRAWVDGNPLGDDFTRKVEKYVKSLLADEDKNLDLAEFVDVSTVSDPVTIDLYLLFDHDNSIKRTKRLCEAISNDISIYLNDNYGVSRLCIFWETPYIVEEGYGAKYIYEAAQVDGESILKLSDSLGAIYEKN